MAVKQKKAQKPVVASIQLLERRLKHAGADVREKAVAELTTLGAPLEQITDVGEKLLTSQDWFARRAAAACLARSADIGASEQAAEKASPYMEHPDTETRRCASEVMSGIVCRVSEPKPKKMVEEKGGMIAQDDEEEKDLGNDQDRRAGAELAARETAARIRHPDVEIRKNAIVTLSRMAKLAEPHAAVLAQAVSDNDVTVRNCAVRAVDRLGNHVMSCTADMAKGLESGNEAIRHSAGKAIVALSHHNGPAAAAGLATFFSSLDPVTRTVAANWMEVLGPLGAPHFKELTHLIEDTELHVRKAGIRAFVAAGPGLHTKQLKELEKLQSHPDREVQRAAEDVMRGLASQKKDFMRHVGKVLHEEADEAGGEDVIRAHRQALFILGGAQHNSEPYLGDALRALEDKEWMIRRAAIECLADLQEHATPVAGDVAKRLNHSKPEIRRSAAEALGRMGLHAGKYRHRVEALLDTEEDNDVIGTCKLAVEMQRKASKDLAQQPAPVQNGQPLPAGMGTAGFAKAQVGRPGDKGNETDKEVTKKPEKALKHRKAVVEM